MKSAKATNRSHNGFDDLGIAPNLIKAIDRLGFESPTPIQKEAIPAGIRGEDIIAVAQTGSGKTMAFGIPMLQRLSQNRNGIGLVLVPTRELAIQVEESLQLISRSSNIRSAVLIGGVSMLLQINALKRGARVLIATPGRLLDHLDRRTVKLADLEVFILDEADRMLDMGFIHDIKKIIKAVPEKRQTMLFSATMPKEVEAIAQSLMEKPTRFEIDRSGATPSEVSHEMFILKNTDKSRLLAVRLKECSGPVLVFTRTKWMARKLTTRVNRMGFATAEIHSNRSQGQRRDALEGFRRGKYQVLVATDIAARGIDVNGIELVVNYDMPATSEDYVHRIGRTGRAGKTGRAISFATTEQEGSIRDIERFMKTKLAISSLPKLPSEKRLLGEADQSSMRTEPSWDERSPRRRTSEGRPSKHRFSRKNDSAKSAFTQTDSRRKFAANKDSGKQESRRKAFKSNDSDGQVSSREVAKRNDSDGQSPKRKLFKRDDSTGPRPKRKKFKSKSSNGQGPKHEAFKHGDSDGQRPKRKVSNPKSSKQTEGGKSKSKSESSFWTNFKKHRPSKKKSGGEGFNWKKRSKRK